MPIRHATPRVYPLSLRPGRGGAQTLPTSVFSSLMRGVPESFWPPASVGASMQRSIRKLSDPSRSWGAAQEQKGVRYNFVRMRTHYTAPHGDPTSEIAQEGFGPA